MRKFIILISALCLSIGSAFAQTTGTIKATLIDAQTKEGVNGAVVELLNNSNGKVQYYSSGYKGSIEIKHIIPGEYKMTITFLGYTDLVKDLKVKAGTNSLGTLSIETGNTVIENIEVTGFMGTSQKGDTVSYNASAFKTTRDASAEGLLAKMPGITINSDGSVDAQGESVGKVFVDGKEFFGEDVSTTIKTIPAEMVAKVEVYDKLSDKAEFTGMDDGEGYKAINIVTSMGKRRGVFGKAYGSYGYPDKYNVGGNANIFNGDEKISIIGMANNINQLNFSFEDIVGATSTGSGGSGGGPGRGTRKFMVHPMAGISTVQSLGLNYSNEWDKLELQGSYFVNHSTTNNENTTDRTNLSSGEYSEHSLSKSVSQSENWNHRINLRMDYDFSKTKSLMLRTMASFQQFDDTTNGTESITNGATGAPLKNMISLNNQERNGSYGRAFALYRMRLGKPGRTITANASVSWNTSNLYQMPEYTFTIPTDSLYQNIIESASTNNSVGGEFTYTEPLGEKTQLDLEYEITHNFSDQEKISQVFINGIEDPIMGSLLSNISESGYTRHRIGPGVNFASEKVKFNGQLRYQHSSLNNLQTIPARDPQSYRFNDFTYNANLTVNFNKQNVLRVRARSNTSNPSISQLQEATDVNGSSYTAGNPQLKPSYNHNINAFYTNTNIEKGRTLMLHAGLWASTRSISSSIQMNRPDFVIPGSGGQTLGVGNTYSTYENISGMNNWGMWLGTSYGFPFPLIKSNITFRVNANLSSTPSMINDHLNIMLGQNYSGGVQIGSNVSENLDFTLAYNFSYSINDNSSSIYSQQNHYFNHNARAEVKWIAWKGFTLTANGTYNQYKGITDNYNEEILLCNAYIGKKILKDQMGEISIGVNDIFNQNRDFRRTTGANYIQNTTNLAIGRYVAVQFVYNIRAFGKGSSAKDFDNIGMGGGRGGHGGPPRH